MRQIQIGERSVKVDDSDYAAVSKWKWSLNKGRYNRGYYAVRGVREGKRVIRVYMSRFICQAKSGERVDFINGDSLDYRRENLRKDGKRVNMLSSLPLPGIKSQYVGVSYYAPTGRWTAMYGGEPLGYYGTEEEAAVAYNTAVYADIGTEGYKGNHMNRIDGKALIGNLSDKNKLSDKRNRKSKYRGVRQKSKGCWEASIQHNNVRHHLGFHNSEIEAGRAFNAKCEELGCLERKNDIV